MEEYYKPPNYIKSHVIIVKAHYLQKYTELNHCLWNYVFIEESDLNNFKIAMRINSLRK